MTLRHSEHKAIFHLEEITDNTKIDSNSSTTTECEICSFNKAHKLISRYFDKKDPVKKSLAQIAYNLIQINPMYNKKRWINHFIYYYITMNFVYMHFTKNQAFDAIKQFFEMIKICYNQTIRYFCTDKEKMLEKKFDIIMISLKISTECSAIYISAQNDAAENSEEMIVTRTCCLRISASFSANLGSEIVKATGYLNNHISK